MCLPWSLHGKRSSFRLPSFLDFARNDERSASLNEGAPTLIPHEQGVCITACCMRASWSTHRSSRTNRYTTVRSGHRPRHLHEVPGASVCRRPRPTWAMRIVIDGGIPGLLPFPRYGHNMRWQRCQQRLTGEPESVSGTSSTLLRRTPISQPESPCAGVNVSISNGGRGIAGSGSADADTAAVRRASSHPASERERHWILRAITTPRVHPIPS